VKITTSSIDTDSDARDGSADDKAQLSSFEPRMRAPHFLYSSLLGLGCVGAMAAACTDDPAPIEEPNDIDSGVDAPAAVDSAPPKDVGSDAPSRDCKADLDTDGLQKNLDCAHFYEDFAAKKVSVDNRPFAPGLVFWSDGAEKERFVFLPPNTTIDITTFDEWKLPTGTRFWKEFKINGKRIETRLFEKTAAGWKHATYRWNDAETAAVRKNNGERIELPNRTPYEIPKPEDCDYCHSGRVEPVLGFDALSLGVSTATGVTLSVLAAENRLAPAPAPVTTFTIPDDQTGKASDAIGWLHANCGHCHNDNTASAGFGAKLKMLVRPSHLLATDGGAPDGGVTARDLPVYVTGVCKPSERDNGLGGKYLYIAGGSPSTSIADILLSSRADAGSESIVSQMPPIVTHMVDVVGKKKVDDWISALPVCP
jgi:hypothetical protein